MRVVIKELAVLWRLLSLPFHGDFQVASDISAKLRRVHGAIPTPKNTPPKIA
jgi:hypothetical protein